jgi:hypothetical protein
MVMAFVVSTRLFWVACRTTSQLERRTDVAGLRIFRNTCCRSSRYLVMLTAYLGKCIDRCGRWIGYLVSSVATVGILAWLLVRPPEMAEHRCVTYTRLLRGPVAAIVMLAPIGKVANTHPERRYFLSSVAVVGTNRTTRCRPATSR